MCGKDLKKINHNLFHSGWADITEKRWRNLDALHNQVSMIPTLGGVLPNYSGQALENVVGIETPEARKEKDAARREQAFLKQQYAPLPPEKTAMSADMNADVRNRQRRAALLGISQLQTPSGPGVASGNDYSGVNG